MITWLYFINFAATVLLMGISIFRNKRVDARISDIRLSAVLKVILTFYSTLVFGLVMTIGYSDIYYKSVRLEGESDITIW